MVSVLKYRRNISVWIIGSLFLLFGSCTFILNAQDIQTYTKEKERLLKEIENSTRLLDQTKSERSETLGKVDLLTRKISNRYSLLNVYENQLSAINKKIGDIQSTIDELSAEIKKVRDEYELLILEVYKRHGSFNEVSFFLASESFNQAYLRYRMINEINDYRRSQGIVLKNTRDAIQVQKTKLEQLKQETSKVLSGILNEKDLLVREKREKESYITKLQAREKQLLNELENKRRSADLLESKIYELIHAAAADKGTKLVSEFGKNKGKLQWPVKGSVVSFFGEHNHPQLKGVKVKNNGIDIKCDKDNRVKAIFKGEVSRVVGIPGYNMAVIVRHGKFLTVYANLTNVLVKNGQSVKIGDPIGDVYIGTGDNQSVMHFEIWEENSKVNPLEWLKK